MDVRINKLQLIIQNHAAVTLIYIFVIAEGATTTTTAKTTTTGTIYSNLTFRNIDII